MTQEKDPLSNEIINFSFTVEQVNAILQILGSAPYLASAPLISLIKMQGEPQFTELLKKVPQNESETAS